MPKEGRNASCREHGPGLGNWRREGLGRKGMSRSRRGQCGVMGPS